MRASVARPQTPRRRWWIVAPLIVAVLGMTVWIGKKWISHQTVEPDSTSSAIVLQPEQGTFIFDGKSRIMTPLMSFAPCTLEAWVRTTGNKSEQFIIGSDVPHNFGIGFGVKNNDPIVETIRGGFDIDKPITPGKWTHLAAVYGPEETTLFMNGKNCYEMLNPVHALSVDRAKQMVEEIFIARFEAMGAIVINNAPTD